MKKYFSALFVLCLVSAGYADEPLGTPAERANLRDAVVWATVVEISKVKENPNQVFLMKATLKITRIEKNHSAIPKDGSIDVYYETSPLGARMRCPAYAVLYVGDLSQFYLRYNEHVTGKKDFSIEMGSDVKVLKKADSNPEK